MHSDQTIRKKVVIELPYRLNGVGRFFESIANTVFAPFSKRVYHVKEERSLPFLRVYNPQDSLSVKKLSAELGEDSVSVIPDSDPKYGLDCLYYDISSGGVVLTDPHGGEIHTWENLASLDDMIKRTKLEQQR